MINSLNINTKNFLELNGEKVYLKKLGKEYFDEYYELFKQSDVEAMIFTGTQQVFSKANVEGFIDKISEDDSRVDFIIFSKDSNKIVGEVVINDIYRNNRSSNIRILLFKKEDFSKGYGSEALILALNYGFGMLNLHRIELEALSFNERAIHVYEKAGFKKESIKRDGTFFNHKYYDVLMMSILEDEFRERYVDKKIDMKLFL